MRQIRYSVGLMVACAAGAFASAGCGTLLARAPGPVSASFADEAPTKREVHAESTKLLEPIRASLSVESWRPNRDWTPAEEWAKRNGPYPSPANLRWVFGSAADANSDGSHSTKPADLKKLDSKSPNSALPKKPEQIAKADPAKNGDANAPATSDETKSAAGPDEGSAPWDGFWPLTVSDLVRRGEGRSLRNAATTVDGGIECLRQLATADNLTGWNAAILLAQHDPQRPCDPKILERLVLDPPTYVVETGENYSEKGNEASGGRAAKPSAGSNDAKRKPESQPPLPRRPTRKISPATQAAAAEAWCLVLAASAAHAVDGLAPAGQALERTNLPNSIRGELFRGVAAWVAPAHIPRLENALRQGDKKSRAPTEIRQAAIEACLIYAINRERSQRKDHSTRVASDARERDAQFPPTILNCRIDPDFQVRRAYIEWVGRARPNGAFDLLKTQAQSAEISLRAVALESLGRLHTDAAHAEIKAQAEKTRDSLRAAAVHALSGWGIEEVAHYTHDRSQVVRIAVADELGKRPTLDSAVLLAPFVIDNNVDVQLAAVEAVKAWPDDLVFPLLLHAMRDSSAKTRLAAFGQLSQRRKVEVDYRFDGPPEQRQAAVNAIAAAVGSSLSYLDQVLRREPRAVSQADALRAAEIREHLAALIENAPESPAATAAREWLSGIGPKDLSAVEGFLKDPTKASPEPVYRDVLPRISPVYAALIDLESTELTVRRRGAQALADRGQAASLSRPILSRLQERLYRETDEFVWRCAMMAIDSDATEECAQIANLALHHQSAEVRTLGCEYLARHGEPAHAVWLLELLDDRDRSVKLAAIRALGNCGNQIAVRGLKPDKSRNASPNLRSLLSSSDPGVRFAAAVSLCRLGTPEGMQELVRFSYQANPHTREEAVREMGLSGQTRFVAHLVSLGWTERNAQVRQAILDSLDRLVPEENRPRALGETPALDAKIKCWVQWLQARDGAATVEAKGTVKKGPTPGGPVVSRPVEAD